MLRRRSLFNFEDGVGTLWQDRGVGKHREGCKLGGHILGTQVLEKKPDLALFSLLLTTYFRKKIGPRPNIGGEGGVRGKEAKDTLHPPPPCPHLQNCAKKGAWTYMAMAWISFYSHFQFRFVTPQLPHPPHTTATHSPQTASFFPELMICFVTIPIYLKFVKTLL